MPNFLFELVSGEYEGEEFFVQAANKIDAVAVARKVAEGEKVRYLGAYNDEEAEWMGYDTYSIEDY